MFSVLMNTQKSEHVFKGGENLLSETRHNFMDCYFNKNVSEFCLSGFSHELANNPSMTHTSTIFTNTLTFE